MCGAAGENEDAPYFILTKSGELLPAIDPATGQMIYTNAENESVTFEELSAGLPFGLKDIRAPDSLIPAKRLHPAHYGLNPLNKTLVHFYPGTADEPANDIAADLLRSSDLAFYGTVQEILPVRIEAGNDRPVTPVVFSADSLLLGNVSGNVIVELAGQYEGGTFFLSADSVNASFSFEAGDEFLLYLKKSSSETPSGIYRVMEEGIFKVKKESETG